MVGTVEDPSPDGAPPDGGRVPGRPATGAPGGCGPGGCGPGSDAREPGRPGSGRPDPRSPEAAGARGGRAAFDAVVLAGGTSARMGGGDKTALAVGGVPILDRVVAAAADAGAGTVVVVGPERPVGRPVVWTREQPPLGGPAAAVAAGLDRVRADVVVLLAGDLPHVDAAAVAALVQALGAPREAVGAPREAVGGPRDEVGAARDAPGDGRDGPGAAAASPGGGAAPAGGPPRGGPDGAVALDGAGVAQPLLSAWRTASLRWAVALRAGRVDGCSMRALLAPLAPVPVVLPAAGVPGAAPGPPPWRDVDTPADLEAARRDAGGPGHGTGSAAAGPGAAPASGAVPGDAPAGPCAAAPAQADLPGLFHGR